MYLHVFKSEEFFALRWSEEAEEEVEEEEEVCWPDAEEVRRKRRLLQSNKRQRGREQKTDSQNCSRAVVLPAFSEVGKR